MALLAHQALAALAVLLAAGAVPHRAAAEDLPPLVFSGEGMLEACEELERNGKTTGPDSLRMSGQDAPACWGFMGAMMQVSRYGDDNKHPILKACLPPNGSLLQFVRVFTTFVRAHPELLHERPVDLAVLAFQAAFPCK
jgi:hypothetical protein